MTARAVMNRQILSAHADWPLERLVEFFIEHDISGAPVIDEAGYLLGVVSLTDVVRHNALPQREPQVHGPAAYEIDDVLVSAFEDGTGYQLLLPSDVSVRDIMTPALYDVSEEAPLAEVADLMIRGRIHRVFVTRGDNVVGLITALDLLKALRETEPQV